MIQNSVIEIKIPHGLKMIRALDIVYIEAVGKFSIIHMREDNTIISYNMLKWFCNSLPSSYFFRNHNSYIVSFFFVENYDSKNIRMVNKIKLPISRKKREIFKSQLKLFIEGR
jgi:DNA-binding LytR/AlgR family response regulator